MTQKETIGIQEGIVANKAAVPRWSRRGHASKEHSIEVISFRISFMYHGPTARRVLMGSFVQVDLLEG